MSKVYDVIILGGGPAGLSAGLYAGRARLSTLMIEKLTEGGQIVTTNEIENYPGGMEHESGPSLIARMVEQCKKFGVETIKTTVTEVQLEGDIKTVTAGGNTYQAKTIMVATGANPRPIGCTGESDYIGQGVSFCATCDGAFFEDLDIYVVGGGDSAVEEALYLTRFGRKVTIIHRRDELRAAKYLQEQAFANDKIEFMWDSTVTEIGGDEVVQKMTVENLKTGEKTEIVASDEDGAFGIFVFVGLIPNSDIFQGKLDMENGYIITNENMETNIKGVFAIGDIRVKMLRQVVTAAADGAIAAIMADKYISGH
ncbi:MAG: thioredoxin-disulfide reductase [Defluviitaleaceae bacterium]|nr:thioredoxin-disulfide reductase [Defluviitaleaceae bacterium]